MLITLTHHTHKSQLQKFSWHVSFLGSCRPQIFLNNHFNNNTDTKIYFKPLIKYIMNNIILPEEEGIQDEGQQFVVLFGGHFKFYLAFTLEIPHVYRNIRRLINRQNDNRQWLKIIKNNYKPNGKRRLIEIRSEQPKKSPDILILWLWLVSWIFLPIIYRSNLL